MTAWPERPRTRRRALSDRSGGHRYAGAAGTQTPRTRSPPPPHLPRRPGPAARSPPAPRPASARRRGSARAPWRGPPAAAGVGCRPLRGSAPASPREGPASRRAPRSDSAPPSRARVLRPDSCPEWPRSPAWGLPPPVRSPVAAWAPRLPREFRTPGCLHRPRTEPRRRPAPPRRRPDLPSRAPPPARVRLASRARGRSPAGSRR
jgi:hypothetical protein